MAFNRNYDTLIIELNVVYLSLVQSLEIGHLDFLKALILVDVEFKLIVEKILTPFISTHLKIIIKLRSNVNTLFLVKV